MIRNRAYDVAEMGLTYYLRTLDFDDPPFLALPVFLARAFRHSAIYVNTACGIKTPRDLAGKIIGEFGMYGHDAGVWPKGILSDEFGLKPQQSRWIIGASDWYMKPFDFIPQPHPADVDVQPVPDGKALGEMLAAGEIDAFLSARAPKCFMDHSPKVARLFPEYERVEREYYRRTGIFPIMHIVVVRKELVAEHPELAQILYTGFCEAKDAAMQRYRMGMVEQNIKSLVPWLTPLLEENARTFPEDWWPYGVNLNRKAIDTFARYFYEQGLSPRRRTCEGLFPSSLQTT